MSDIGAMSFPASVWEFWTGNRLTTSESILLEACLLACMDHGSEPPSAYVAHIVGSCSKPIADAVAAGLLTLGPRHGNASGAASRLLREALSEGMSADRIVSDAISSKHKLPGYGHAVYKDADPRVVVLTDLAKKNLTACLHVNLALGIEKEFGIQKGKPIPLNIDGMIGAIVADLGGDAELADAIFICGRAFGLVKHARSGAARETYLRPNSL